MKHFLKLSILFFLLGIFSQYAFSQGFHNPESIKDELAKKIMEAFEKQLEKDNNYSNEEDNQNYGRTIRSGDEILISESSQPESEVHAVINPTDSNNIVVSPMKYSLSGLRLPIYYTKDFGQTWNKSNFQADPGITGANVVGGGDPMFAFDADGKLYFSWINIYTVNNDVFWAMFWAFSEDGGENWQRADNDLIAISNGKLGDPGFFGIKIAYDKQWMMVDKTGSQYHNNLYTAMVEIDLDYTKTKIVVRKKAPDSDSFEQTSIPISDETFMKVQFSSIDVDEFGFVHVTFWGTKDESQYAIWHSISKDGANSFETPDKVSDMHMPASIFGIKDSRLYTCPQFIIDKSNAFTKGNLYCVWTADGINSELNNRSDIYFSRSIDNGFNWSTPKIINDDLKDLPREQFYPSISVSPEGIITLTWYDSRHSDDNSIVNYYICNSLDGGLTFTKNFSVNSASTNFNTIGMKNNKFGIGEYTQVISSKGYAIPVWSDGRKQDGDLDIYVAFMSIPVTSGNNSIEKITAISEDFSLSNPYPNPTSHSTEINYVLKKQSQIKFYLMDQNGKIIKVLENCTKQPGKYSLDVNVRHLSSGKYMFLLETDFGFNLRSLIIN